ncbi:MAG: hypothetical protein AB7E52_06835, partial [Bdellovibrionales bacterium]
TGGIPWVSADEVYSGEFDVAAESMDYTTLQKELARQGKNVTTIAFFGDYPGKYFHTLSQVAREVGRPTDGPTRVLLCDCTTSGLKDTFAIYHGSKRASVGKLPPNDPQKQANLAKLFCQSVAAGPTG